MFTTLADIEKPSITSDVLVVGSGPAGLAVAVAARERGARVTLLESGGRRARRDPLNDVIASIQAFPGAYDGRLRGFGGAGEAWAGQCLPLDDIDLADRSWVPGSGWPVEPAELETWVKKAAVTFQVDGASFDGNDLDRAGVTLPPFDPSLLRWRVPHYSPDHRLGSSWRKRFADDPDLTVVLDATVVALQRVGDRVVGVDVRDRRGTTRTATGAVTVLACGALENTRLLLDAADSPDDMPTLGRGFQDHPYWLVGAIHDAPPELAQIFQSVSVGGRRLRPKVGLAPAEQQRRQTLNGVADLELDHGPRSSVGAVKRLTSAVRQRRRPPHLMRELTTVAADPAGLVREAAHRRRGVGAPADRFTRLLLKVQTEQPPTGPSHLTLSDRRDEFGLRMLDVAWVVGEEERRTCQAMAEVVAGELQRCGLGRLETFAWLDEPQRFRAEAHDFYHHAGTTRMAADPQDGVVDTDCRVHGLEGLYVTGGSVFPTSGHAHPTLMIVAMALRLADHLSTVTTPGR